MHLRQLLLLVVFLFSALLYSQTYEITEAQLTNLETTIENQKASIEKQATLLTNSGQKTEKLESLTNLSEEIIKQQETLLQKSESRSWIDRLYNWFIGVLSGGLFVMILTYTHV